MTYKILLIQEATKDSVTNIALKKKISENFFLLYAQNTKEIINILQKYKISVIILDSKNNKLLNYLKQNFAAYCIPIIAVKKQNEISSNLINKIDDYIASDTNNIELKNKILLSIKRSQKYLTYSPLTFLPGNICVNMQIINKIKKCKKFILLYIDIDNFKQYNDQYGFYAGDKVLKKTSTIFRNILKTSCNKQDFLGHIGGDDFVIITENLNVSILLKKIKCSFKKNFPELSLTIAVINNKNLTNIEQISELAAKLKTQIKKRESIL